MIPTYKSILTFAVCATLAGCGSDSDGASENIAGGSTVDATVKAFEVTAEPASVPAGDVTFNVTNIGESTHEFLVVRTDLAADKLPVDGNAVDETSPDIDIVDEIEDIEPGQTMSLSITLEAGDYVLICNLPAHYQSGMYLAFEVT